MAHRVASSKKLSMNDLSKVMMSSIEKEQSHSNFSDLYRNIFRVSNIEGDYKSLHRFIRRNTYNTCLKPNDNAPIQKLNKFKRKYHKKSFFEGDLETKLLSSNEVRDSSTHSCKSFRKHVKTNNFETQITLIGHEFDSNKSSSE